MPSSSRPTRRRALCALITAAIAFCVGVSGAEASSDIEGVWSFGGGQIAVQPLSDGTYQGTVVAETKFAECVHPVGEVIWTDLAPQPDGSYWGLHQWYFEHSGCKENPERGPAAWRVLEEPDGASYLLVCLSDPGTTQPAIAPSGASSGATYGCIKSALTAPLPTTSLPVSGSGSAPSGSTGTSAIERLTLPSAKRCLSARVFKIHLAEPKYDPFKTVKVMIKKRSIPTKREGDYVVATINLKGLKRGEFTVVISATTVLGHHLSGTRTYHTCAKKAKHAKPTKLH